MDALIFLARFWGWMLVLMSLVYLVRQKSTLPELFKAMHNKEFTLLTGYIALIVGLGSILMHNVWSGDWRVVVTIFGWLSLLKGITRIAAPEATQSMLTYWEKKSGLINVFLVLALFIGAWLLYMSYI